MQAVLFPTTVLSVHCFCRYAVFVCNEAKEKSSQAFKRKAGLMQDYGDSPFLADGYQKLNLEPNRLSLISKAGEISMVRKA